MDIMYSRNAAYIKLGEVFYYMQKNYINVVKISKTDVDAYDSLYVEVTEKK